MLIGPKYKLLIICKVHLTMLRENQGSQSLVYYIMLGILY